MKDFYEVTLSGCGTFESTSTFLASYPTRDQLTFLLLSHFLNQDINYPLKLLLDYTNDIPSLKFGRVFDGLKNDDLENFIDIHITTRSFSSIKLETLLTCGDSRVSELVRGLA